MERTKVHPHPVGLAAGLTAGIAYTICAATVALWPTQTLGFFASWFHGIDLTKIVGLVQLTFGNFIVGLIGIVLSLYIIGFVYALFYNMCYAHCKKRKWI